MSLADGYFILPLTIGNYLAGAKISHLALLPQGQNERNRRVVDMIARELEDRALNDDYFIERKLYPNVDFYSGIILRAVGIPKNMFPVMFAIGRLPGWIAHWREMVQLKADRIDCPRQIYTGHNEHHYVSMDQRS